MKKIIVTTILLVSCLLTFVLFRSNDNKPTMEVDVAVSTFPLYVITQSIAGDSLKVQLIGSGSDPHSFEPSAQDMRAIDDAALFITNGNDLDHWTEDVNTDTEKVILTEEINSDNTHIWLNPSEAIEVNNAINQLLNNKFPSYIYNDEIEQSLRNLQNDYINAIQRCTIESITVTHNAFEALGEEFGFGIYEINSNEHEEISSKDIVNAIAYIQDNNLRHVLADPNYNTDYIRLIENEVQIEILPISNYETGNQTNRKQNSQEYVDILRENLTTLKTALACNQ